MSARTKSKPKPTRTEGVVFGREPQKSKLCADIDVAITIAIDSGLSRAVIIESLLLMAESLCVIAKERGEDLSSLQGILA